MKLPIIIILTLLLVMSAKAQEKKPEYKIRIRKVEIVNGQTRITDTTYTSTTPPHEQESIQTHGGKIPGSAGSMFIEEDISQDGKTILKKIQISDSVSHMNNGIVVKVGDEMNPSDLDKMMNQQGMQRLPLVPRIYIDSVGQVPGQKAERIIIMNGTSGDSVISSTAIIKKLRCGATPEEIDREPVSYNVTVIRKARISELSDPEKKMLRGKPTLKSDDKLFAEDLQFSPNPNNGKFNLSFSLRGNGDAQIQILNQEGQPVYDETLTNFTGKYSRDIDISSQPKGVYYARISQGGHSQMKKIVLD